MSLSEYHPDSFLLRELRRRTDEDNMNNIIIFIGRQGIGKTVCALRTCQVLQPDFPIENVCFSVEEFIRRITAKDGNGDHIIKKGHCILWDELSLDMHNREFFKQTHIMVAKYLTVFRTRNIHLIMTVPNLSFVDKQLRTLSHYIFHVTKKNKAEKYNVVIPRDASPNVYTGEVFPIKPMVSDSDKQLQGLSMTRISSLAIRLPTEELSKAYVIKRNSLVKGAEDEFLRYLDAAKKEEPVKLTDDEIKAKILENPSLYWNHNGKRWVADYIQAGFRIGKGRVMIIMRTLPPPTIQPTVGNKFIYEKK